MNSNTKWLIGIGLLLAVGFAWYISMSSNPTLPPTEEANTPIETIPPATSESPTFVNTIWVASSIEGLPANVNQSITVQFDEQGTISGSDGCNSFSGTYSATDTDLIIDPGLASTMMACEDEVMAQATSFTELLIDSTSYELGDGVLVLYQNETAGLIFTGQTNSLSKTSWGVTSYNNGNQAVVGVIADTSPEITFGDDGTISGNAGCNTFSGTYSLSGQSIEISPLATTMRECIEPEDIMQQEQALLSALTSASEWQIQGDQLSLRTIDDALAIVAISSLSNSTP
jgi:heat shock protein HslJ